MGIIVELPRRASSARAMAGGNAEIVIFPGVQIERRDFTLSERIDPPPRRRRLPAPAQSQAIDIEK